MNESRLAYRRLINKIEEDYPVREWLHNDYHIWPILRIHLYMRLVKQNENIERGKSYSAKRIHRILQMFNVSPSTWVRYLNLEDNIDTLYFGASSHRVIYQNKMYNRYFDPLMDKEAANNILLEYSSDTNDNYYKRERVLLLSKLLNLYKLYSEIDYRFSENNRHAIELDSIVRNLGYELGNLVSQLSRKIYSIDRFIYFFSKLLQRTKPKKIYELCYYSSSMLALNIAADKLEIPTIDMQHGPQGINHLAYGSWHSIPLQGYEALPNLFYTWDISSADTIQEWADNTNKHSAVCTGNPWVQGWKRGEFISSDYQWPKNLILYSLQPIGDPLEPYLLETIRKTCDKWNWWLRLHPRQMADLDSIKNKLIKAELLDRVNIENATSLLLPEILTNTKVHLTKFSGCAIEAFNFETPTIVLDKRGADIFEHYFTNSKMSLCTSKDSKLLIGKIKNYLQ